MNQNQVHIPPSQLSSDLPSHRIWRWLAWIVPALGLVVALIIPQVSQASGGWYAEYFANSNLAGSPVLTRTDGDIDFDWGGGSPDASVPADHFSVRWTQTVYFEEGEYEFSVGADDGVRLFVDGSLIIDDWRTTAYATRKQTIRLGEGNHALRLEYFESTGNASVRLRWVRKGSGRLIGNIITWANPGTWIKIYRRMPDGSWQNMNENGWGPIDASGRLKIDGLPVDPYYGGRGQPYRVELRTQGAVLLSVGDTDAGQPEFRVYPSQDNYTPWGPNPATTQPQPIPTAVPQKVVVQPTQPEQVVVVVPPGTEVVIVRQEEAAAPAYGIGGLATGTIANAYHLNVRYGPGVGYRVATRVDRGQIVEVTGYRNAAATWIQIRANGVTGWVNAYYVRTTVPIRQMTVAR